MLFKAVLLTSLVALAVGFSSKGLKVPQNPDGYMPPSRRTVSKVNPPVKGHDVKGVQQQMHHPQQEMHHPHPQQHQQHPQQDVTKGELRAAASEDQPDFHSGFDNEDENSGHEDGSSHGDYSEAPVPIHNEGLLRSGEEYANAPMQHPVKGYPQQQEEVKGYPPHGVKSVHVPPVKGLKRPPVKGHPPVKGYPQQQEEVKGIPQAPVKGYPQQQEEVKGIPQAPVQVPDVKGYPQHPEVKSPPQQHEVKTVQQQQYDTKSVPLPPVKGKRVPFPRHPVKGHPVKGFQQPQVPQMYDQSPYFRRPAVTLLRTPHGFEHSEGLAVVVESGNPIHPQVQEPQIPQEPQVHIPQEPQVPVQEQAQSHQNQEENPQNSDY
ncbi:uncharacterized protein LOC141855622 [Brevipalpus obovatus]|uniref:uncharacterized protein LOC141855622 n=1 Tax=Brevipalpus obovatus TaxID=246614 RepID=UPI003D9F32B6